MLTLDEYAGQQRQTLPAPLQAPPPKGEGGFLSKLGVSGLNFALGAAEPVHGLNQALEKATPQGMLARTIRGATGLQTPEQARAKLKEGVGQMRESVYSQGAGSQFSPAEFAGNVLSPVYGAASLLPRAPSYIGRVTQGSGVGAGVGATTPVEGEGSFLDYLGSKTKQMGAGALASAAIPAVISPIASGIHHIVEPWLKGGKQAISGRILNEAAGSKRPGIVKSLEENRNIVPGSPATAGEAATNVGAGSPEFSAIQRAASNRPHADYINIEADQQAARRGALRKIGGTPEELVAGEKALASKVDPLYETAKSQFVQADRELFRMLRRPAMKAAMQEAGTQAANKTGSPFPAIQQGQSISVQTLHDIKVGLDNVMAKPDLSGYDRKILGDLKNQYLKWIEDRAPDYQTARAAKWSGSIPLDQMRVGQYLENKLVPALEDTERATGFAQAVRDAPGTLKKATGEARYDDLSQLMTPAQIQGINHVGEELARRAKFSRLAQRGSAGAQGTLREELAAIEAPPLLWRPVVILNYALARIQGQGRGATLDELSRIMKSPRETAMWMQQAEPGVRSAFVNALRDIGTVGAGMSAAKLPSTTSSQPPSTQPFPNEP